MPTPPREAPVIEACALTLRQGRRPVLHNAALTVESGEAVGLVGANGSGKSTLLRAIAGLARPHRGQLRVLGGAPYRRTGVRRRIGWLPEQVPQFPELTVRAVLRYAAALAGVPGGRCDTAADAAVERCGLAAVAHRRSAHLSLGYRRRLGLAQALVHEPALLLLDEPSNGLDAEARESVYWLLQGLRPALTLIIATHVPADLAALATRTTVLRDGRLHAAAVDYDWALSLASGTGPAPAALAGVDAAFPQGDGRWRLRLSPGTDPAEVLARGVEGGWRVRDWRWLGHDPETLITASAASPEAA